MAETRIGQIMVELSVLNSVDMRLSAVGELPSNPNRSSVAFHLAFLEVGARLPLQPYIQRVLHEIGVAPAQLNPNVWRIIIRMHALWEACRGGEEKDGGQGKEYRYREKETTDPISTVTNKGGTSDMKPGPKHTRMVGSSTSVTISEARMLPPNAIPLFARGGGGNKTPHVQIEGNLGRDNISKLFMHDTKISLNYCKGAPTRQFVPKENPISPKTDVEFMCSYGKDMLRSGKSVHFGKCRTWIRFNSLRRESYEKLKQRKSEVNDKLRLVRGNLESLKAKVGELSASYRKAKVYCGRKHAKLCDYRQLKAIESQVKPTYDPVADISSVFTEVAISDGEPSDVSSEDERMIEVASGGEDDSDVISRESSSEIHRSHWEENSYTIECGLRGITLRDPSLPSGRLYFSQRPIALIGETLLLHHQARFRGNNHRRPIIPIEETLLF
ncbi:hypothetical protein Ddye_000752 [Dipteronia dyeriana]|uniref:Transposase (putative) gypsy type domain-containing protein n=1 Tax=Dipteronia dyeriana TaxID=168575 RepID=A0AAD9XMW5_9ROSI|nr:hypothetical protein Ddye_000752 [Dipteronia dyeriana]